VLHLLWYGLLAVILAAGLFAAAARFLPAGEQIAPPLRDEPPWELPPDRVLQPDDVDAVRLPVALRGYRFAETDTLLDRLASELRARDEEIARLRGHEPAEHEPALRRPAPDEPTVDEPTVDEPVPEEPHAEAGASTGAAPGEAPAPGGARYHDDEPDTAQVEESGSAATAPRPRSQRWMRRLGIGAPQPADAAKTEPAPPTGDDEPS
jgi:hypothetical protein